MNILFTMEARSSTWSEIRVLWIEKISIASSKDVVVLKKNYGAVHAGQNKMKSQRDVKLRCLFERRGQPLRAKMFVNFEFREQNKIEQRSPIKKKSLFSSVLVANNGRLALRARVRYDTLEIFWRWCPHLALTYHVHTTPPRTKDNTCTATSVGRWTCLEYRICCSTGS